MKKKTKTIGPSVFTLAFVRMPECSFVSQELLDKTLYVHYQTELNEVINLVCFICHFTHVSQVNSLSQNFLKIAKDGNLKIQIY